MEENKRTKPFIRVPQGIIDWLPIIGHKGFAVYAYICGRANPKRGTWCTESLPHMAGHLRMCRHSLQKTLMNLNDLGLLEKVNRQHAPAKYKPVDPEPPSSQQVENNLPHQVKNVLPQKDDSVLMKKPHQVETTPQQDENDLQTRERTRVNKNGRKDAPVNAKTLVQEFRRYFEEKYKDPYEPDWGKDGTLFKNKLRGIPAEVIRAKMGVFFNGWWEKHWKSKEGSVRPKIGDFIADLERIPSRKKEKIELKETGTSLEEIARQAEEREEGSKNNSG